MVFWAYRTIMKVFRRFRYHFLEKGRIRNYILYAIGEIILVVIGILLALQINIWNEDRKKRDLEQNYYCLLLDEIIQDSLQLESLVEKVNERIDHANQAILLLQGTNPDITQVSIAYLKSIRYSPRTFDPNEATFEDIKSGGNLGVIHDKSVISLMNRYYKNVDGYTSAILKNVETDYNNLADLESWLDAGIMNGLDHFHPNLFTEEIRRNLASDMPRTLSKDISSILYNNVLTVGVNNHRRRQLLDNIKKEVVVVHEALKKKCTDRSE